MSSWGDAAHLVDILDVRPEGDGRFVSVARASEARPVVEGSQMLGQAIVAASRQAPGRRVVSAIDGVPPRCRRRPAPDLPARRAERRAHVHDHGGVVLQDDRLRASGMVLLGETTPDVIRHAAPPPPPPGRTTASPTTWASPAGRSASSTTRTPGTPTPRSVPPVLDVWVRFGDRPEDPALHVGLLAQFTGHMSIAAALRPHAGIGQDAAHRTLSTAINAIALSVHADVHADRWMRYHHHSTFAGDGMTHAECRVYDEPGALLASFTVDAMVRPFADPSAPVDERTAL